MTAPTSPSQSSTGQLDLGLRWLDAAESAPVNEATVTCWAEFLHLAGKLPQPKRLICARLWPLLGVINGVVALSGLLVWPDHSGVHLLLFLLTFWLMPLLLLVWTGLSGLVLGRTPWWRLLITPHQDRVIALWFARQSLLAQGLFCLSGLAWLWLMLLTRQVIFYWSTSIAAVSASVDNLFGALGLGLLAAPQTSHITAAQAGAISGWEGALLADSWLWATWLTQVVALWVLLPVALLLLVCQWRLRHGLARWPQCNHNLRLRFEQQCEPSLSYRALQPEQPVTASPNHDFPVLAVPPDAPGFAWQIEDLQLPPGSIPLGQTAYGADQQTINTHAADIRYWFIGGLAVPTGDLADLLRLHLSIGGQPQLCIFLHGVPSARVDALKHSWSAFLDRNGLPLAVQLVNAGAEL